MAELHVLIVLSLTYQSTQQSPQSPISHPLFRDIYIIRYSVTAGYIIQFEVVAVSFWFYFHCGSGSRIWISDPKFLISFFSDRIRNTIFTIQKFGYSIFGSDRIGFDIRKCTSLVGSLSLLTMSEEATLVLDSLYTMTCHVISPPMILLIIKPFFYAYI